MIVFVFQGIVNHFEFACQFHLVMRPVSTVESHSIQLLISNWLQKLINQTADNTVFLFSIFFIQSLLLTKYLFFNNKKKPNLGLKTFIQLFFVDAQ